MRRRISARSRADRLRHPGHESFRTFCRVAGPLLIGVGAIFFIAGVASFFGEHEFGKGPKNFWMCFAGVPILGVGFLLTKIGFLGAAARYVAGEIAPVGRDAVNYMARGTRGAVKDIVGAVAEGLREAAAGASPASARCPACDAENDADAKFCDECGTALRKENTCPECAQANDADANFCDNCGSALGS